MLCNLPDVVMEMLVFSKPGEIELLLTLSERIPSGSIVGVKCRTFAAVNQLKWDFNGKKIRTEISSLTDQNIKVRYRNGIKSLIVDGVLIESEIIEESYVERQLRAGELKTIEINMR